nr:outer membrane beta-barrel protein [uncultured Chitinophaga sp.]
MKKIVISVLAAAAFLGSSQLFAQQKKHFISAGAGFSDQNNIYAAGEGAIGRSSAHYVNISLSYGYYFKERWAFGILGAYSTTNSDNTMPSKSSNWNVGPFVRYEQPIWNSRLSVYADGAALASFTKIDADTEPVTGVHYSEQKASGYNLSITPGLLFHLTPSFSLTANMGSVFAAGVRTTKVGSIKSTSSEAGLFKDFRLNNVMFGINFHF